MHTCIHTYMYINIGLTAAIACKPPRMVKNLFSKSVSTPSFPWYYGLCVCVCVCMYVCMYVFVSLFVCVLYKHAYMSLCTHAYTYICMHIWAYACMHMLIYACIYGLTYSASLLHACMRTCDIHIHTHMYICICIEEIKRTMSCPPYMHICIHTHTYCCADTVCQW